ncbi:MAG: AMP-binding protein, partial [Gammaproteobacteria bacterium]|nr:AMP-binding protein [Gammaproteobacteria bacterium]NNL50164.1 AMP-binding protein [Woeseiaceae bacterium]
DSARVLVGCGRARAAHQVIIVDPETRQQCPADKVGEIWIAGASVAQGYWQHSETTGQVFEGYLDGTGQGPYLRSGDLGFLQDGELFVCGRLKEVIVLGGTNHFSVDIEMTVEQCHPAIRANCVAAVAVEVRGAERLVVIAEVDRRFAAAVASQQHEAKDPSLVSVANVKAAIHEAVSRNHDLSAHDLCLVKQSTISKTSSGKIQRHVCRERYLAGNLVLVESRAQG